MYNPKEIEPKWQKYWEENKTFRTLSPSEAGSKPKKYILDMFPYPSGEWLHVGHPKGFSATDIVSRYYHAEGFNVLHPMGFDAFWLPAENYAIKTGTHPAVKTAANIANFVNQLKELGFAFDWDRMVNTTDPEFYKWTQWIFVKLFEMGLAYEQDLPINYCPSCKTGLANEEVLSDNTCERCGTQVERKKIRQWVLKITEYADRLIEDLQDLDWPEWIKEMQRNWIGKSEGCEFRMKKEGDAFVELGVYTTRIDTVFGMTYAVIAPDHPQVKSWITPSESEACQKYIADSKAKSDIDRTGTKEKTGVFTGSYAVNPFNGEKIPVYIGDYVLGSYGTGAVMAVPAHDERDFEFAKKMGLKIRQSVVIKTIGIWEETPKKDVETLNRKVVDIILENEKGEFLLIYEENPLCYHFVWGGIEEGEAEQQALKRELIEETGYTDFAVISDVPGTFTWSFAYRITKWKNQDLLGRCFHVKLNSENRIHSEIEDGRHKMKWCTKNEVASLISWENHLFSWNVFLHGMKPFTEDGYLVDSAEFTGLTSAEARTKLSEKAEKEQFGSKKINYKLRDWLFSRQRYWGEPIPLIHLETEDLKKLPHITDIKEATDPKIAYILKREAYEEETTDGATCGGKIRELVIGGKVFSKIYDGLYSKIITDPNLPLELPNVERYEPAGDGQSPLAAVIEFVNITLAENLTGKRETNTMPQWGGSCWYYLRYMDPKNPDAIASKEALDYFGMVDEYVGGAEHAVLHLLYARFWHKVLFDLGVVPNNEPFKKLTNVGMILSYAYERPNGGLVAVDLVEERDGKYFEKSTGVELKQVIAKMSKSLKNVLNPIDIADIHGADAVRLYEMNMGAFTDAAPWNMDAIIGVRRFLDKAYYAFEGKSIAKDEMKAMKLLHKTIKKVGEDIVEYKFNTAISALMILVNEGVPTDEENAKEWKTAFTTLLHPFAPHIAEELWEKLGNTTSVYFATWPKYEEFMLTDDEVTIAIQVNGKLRGTVTVLNGTSQEEIASLARENPDITKWFEGLELVREIYVPNKLLSIVMK